MSYIYCDPPYLGGVKPVKVNQCRVWSPDGIFQCNRLIAHALFHDAHDVHGNIIAEWTNNCVKGQKPTLLGHGPNVIDLSQYNIPARWPLPNDEIKIRIEITEEKKEPSETDKYLAAIFAAMPSSQNIDRELREAARMAREEQAFHRTHGGSIDEYDLIPDE